MKIRTTALALLMATSFGSGAWAKDLNKIGLLVGSLGNPFFNAITKGVESEAQKINPAVQVTTIASEYDLAKQLQQIDSFVAAGVDLIVLDAVDPKALGAAIKRAQAAGIYVVGVDEEAEGEDAIFMTDNEKAGEESCQFIVDKLEGQGNVVIINGPQVSSVVARVKGCKSALDKAPGIKILSDNQDGKGSRDGGLAVMQSLMVRFPKIDAVFGINDPSSIGASLALKQSGRSDIFITSVDGSPDIEAAIKDETTQILASASQDPYEMATRAVQAGYELMNGKTVDPVKTLIPPTLITAENLESHKGWNAQH